MIQSMKTLKNSAHQKIFKKKKKKERNGLGDVFLESSLKSYSVLHWDFYILHIYGI